MSFLDTEGSRGKITVKVMIKWSVRRSDLIQLIKQLHESGDLHK